MTGNASQLTNTNHYLTQPHGDAGEDTPGSNYSFLNAVLLAWVRRCPNTDTVRGLSLASSSC